MNIPVKKLLIVKFIGPAAAGSAGYVASPMGGGLLVAFINATRFIETVFDFC